MSCTCQVKGPDLTKPCAACGEPREVGGGYAAARQEMEKSRTRELLAMTPVGKEKTR